MAQLGLTLPCTNVGVPHPIPPRSESPSRQPGLGLRLCGQTELSSDPGSFIYQLCDSGQVIQPPWVPVFSSAQGDRNTYLAGLQATENGSCYS